MRIWIAAWFGLSGESAAAAWLGLLVATALLVVVGLSLAAIALWSSQGRRLALFGLFVNLSVLIYHATWVVRTFIGPPEL